MGRSGEYSEMFRRLESIGGDVIVRESQVSGTDFKKIMADLPAPKLALNGRGGEVMTNTCRLMKWVRSGGSSVGTRRW